MSARTSARRKDPPKHFLVQCEGCPFEHLATGRDNALRIGSQHRRATGHELVAIEIPHERTPTGSTPPIP